MENLAYAYSRARSAGFFAEFFLLQSLVHLIPFATLGQLKKKQNRKVMQRPDAKALLAIRNDLLDLLRQDSLNIARGDYPLSVLMPESPLQHLRRLPKLFADSVAVYLRGQKNKTKDFDREAQKFLGDLPKYYRRNFHFQSNGYLSRRSAEVYDHQVDLLFKGATDAMRRLIIPQLRNRFGSTDGEGLRFLEVAAGTCRATRFVHQAFPKAKIVALDLSDPYLKVAQENLAKFPGISFIQGDAAKLPFKDGEFDAVYSVFLFHELPMDARLEVLRESVRVLKAQGFFGFVDSLQMGDKEIFSPYLKNFPLDFHEPYYRSYIMNPMEDLLANAGIRSIETGHGFTSKVCSGTLEKR